MATITSTVALVVAVAVQRKGLAQPLNATSHWLYGDRAAHVRRASVDFTTVGFGTHAAATIFWAFAFETALALRPTRRLSDITGRAAAIVSMEAIVDYTITPKRFTPGWELVLSKRSMAVVYASIGLGFVLAAK